MSVNDENSGNEVCDVYLAFGGNIGDVKHRIIAAWDSLNGLPIITVVACSRLFRTAPVGGPPDQEHYINAACHVQTTLIARQVLDLCQSVERQFGRVRSERWGPRTLDVDILLYGDQKIDEPDLVVPHPRLRERLFALIPLSDVAPGGLKLPPDGATLKSLLDAALFGAHETLQDWGQRVIN